MIFVAVGTQKFQFNRLLLMIDKLVSEGVIKDEIFAQIGNCTYLPQNFSYKNFLSKEEFDSYIDKCDILITHGGVATIISGLKKNKPIIVLERRACFNEHVDDHQKQIAEVFSDNKFVMWCSMDDKLEDVLKKISSYEFAKYESNRDNVIFTIREYIKVINECEAR